MDYHQEPLVMEKEVREIDKILSEAPRSKIPWREETKRKAIQVAKEWLLEGKSAKDIHIIGCSSLSSSSKIIERLYNRVVKKEDRAINRNKMDLLRWMLREGHISLKELMNDDYGCLKNSPKDIKEYHKSSIISETENYIVIKK